MNFVGQNKLKKMARFLKIYLFKKKELKISECSIGLYVDVIGVMTIQNKNLRTNMNNIL